MKNVWVKLSGSTISDINATPPKRRFNSRRASGTYKRADQTLEKFRHGEKYARYQRVGWPVEWKLYPEPFVRLGGLGLPIKQRGEAMDEIDLKTKGQSQVQAQAIMLEILLKKWNEVVRAPGDTTNLTFGAASTDPFRDPKAQKEARDMLSWIPTCPQFACVLNQEEATVWAMSFHKIERTQATIAKVLGKKQPAISKIVKGAARKLNDRYLQLRDAGTVPYRVVEWLRETVGYDAGIDLYRMVELLRRREDARRKGSPPRSTGCSEMNKLRIRHA
jgi:hypothetical protein